jgi:hypothetical protein
MAAQIAPEYALPPGKRRTYDQAADDDEKRLGAKLRRGRKRGDL